MGEKVRIIIKTHMIVFLDMDGVLVDFVKGALRAHNISTYDPDGRWDMCEVLQITAEDFWGPLNTVEFFENLEPTEEFDFIMNLTDGHERYILTSPSNRGPVAHGKYNWLSRYLPHLPTIMTDQKHLLAYTGGFLIDDCDKYIDSYFGPKVLLPRPWNRNKDKDVLSTLEEEFNAALQRTAITI
jgi:5'(3')-deoxyribonucleotidase